MNQKIAFKRVGVLGPGVNHNQRPDSSCATGAPTFVFLRPSWRVACLVLALAASSGLLSAQETSVPALTNGLVQAEDATGDGSATADMAQDQDGTGTNSVAETNLVVAPGPDGSMRRRIRQAQKRSRSTAPATNSTRASSGPSNSGGSAVDYSAFRLVADRNIFDPNRVPHSGRPAAQPKTVDAFTLVGTMSYEKGIFAFFDGTSSDYKKVLKPEETIAGYKVVAISPDAVKLELNTNVLELTVGTQMRRREDGSWDRSASSENYAASSTSNSSASEAAPSSGAESDVLKKMMQRREKE